MSENRIAWHKQLRVVYMSPPDSRCVEAGSAANLWEYRFILILLSGTTRFGLCAKNVMDFCSPWLHCQLPEPTCSPSVFHPRAFATSVCLAVIPLPCALWLCYFYLIFTQCLQF